MEGLQTLKPLVQKGIRRSSFAANGIKETAETFGGINLELGLVIAEDFLDDELAKWEVEDLKFSVKQPVINLNFTVYRCIHVNFYLGKVLQ